MGILDAADEAIAAFLNARLDEDEAAVHQNQKYCEACTVAWIGGWPEPDHARTIREVQAKRAIIEQARHNVSWYGTGDMFGPVWILAAIYSNHPDYLKEWAA